jgi:hypothetical protein
LFRLAFVGLGDERDPEAKFLDGADHLVVGVEETLQIHGEARHRSANDACPVRYAVNQPAKAIPSALLMMTRLSVMGSAFSSMHRP